jgi:twinkle protein
MSNTKIGTEPCPKCREKGLDNTGDNLAVYADGGKHCFACGHTVMSDIYKEINGYVSKVELMFPVTDYNKEQWEDRKKELTTDPKGFRGLKKYVCDLYRVYHEINEDTGKVLNQYYPISKGNKFSGVKKRFTTPKKDFLVSGENSKQCDLFGQAIFLNSPSKSIILTCGELDALSVFQMLDDNNKLTNAKNHTSYETPPVVSGTVGELGNIKQYMHNYSFLERFDKIIYIPDKDEAGEEALHKLAQALPRDKLFIVDLPTKDPNKMLEDGRSKEFIHAFIKAHAYSPAGIVGSDTIYDKILERSLIPKITFPPILEPLNDALGGGIPLGYICNITAGSGSGKSTLVNEFVLHQLNDKTYKCGVVSLEADAGEYGENLLGAFVKQKLQDIKDPQEKYKYISSDGMRESARELFTTPEGQPAFHLIDDRGDYTQLQKKIEELIISCSVHVVVIDVLTDVFAGQGLTFENQWMAWEKSIVKRYNVAIINVIHIRKSATGQKSASTGGVANEEDMTGSAAQYQSAGINIQISRNKMAETEKERNTIIVALSKNRSTGITSPCICKLFYDRAQHRLYALEDMFPEVEETQESYNN